MLYKQISLGPLMTNCYILYNEQGQCLIIDPGSEGERLIHMIEREHWTPLAVVLTHAHFDHIGAVDEVRHHWNIPVYMHQLEADWLEDPQLNGSARHGLNIHSTKAEHLLSQEKTLTIGDFKLDVLHTPGHSPGSISYYSKEAGVVFSGDTIFEGGIGRTDLLGGDHEQLLSSIKEKLLPLPNETIALPGHGRSITIQFTKEHNPFLI